VEEIIGMIKKLISDGQTGADRWRWPSGQRPQAPQPSEIYNFREYGFQKIKMKFVLSNSGSGCEKLERDYLNTKKEGANPLF